MIEKILQNLTSPENENFWSAWTLVVTIFIALCTFIGWLFSQILNNQVTKTSKILIKANVDVYLDWVQVRSQTQIVDNNTIKIWFTDIGGTRFTGRSYLVYKKFISELKKQGYSNITLQDETTYSNWVTEFDSAPKWSRIEW